MKRLKSIVYHLNAEDIITRINLVKCNPMLFVKALVHNVFILINDNL